MVLYTVCWSHDGISTWYTSARICPSSDSHGTPQQTRESPRLCSDVWDPGLRDPLSLPGTPMESGPQLLNHQGIAPSCGFRLCLVTRRISCRICLVVGWWPRETSHKQQLPDMTPRQLRSVISWTAVGGGILSQTRVTIGYTLSGAENRSGKTN